MIKKQVHIDLNFINPKIKILRNFRVFVLSPIPKCENPEITEILKSRKNKKAIILKYENVSSKAVEMLFK